MKKTWSRKKVVDEFTGMLKADGTPMSRQQIHMLRKKARGICMICAEPAVGVYCLKHTIAVRERMRKKLKYRRRLLNSPSYTAKSAKAGKASVKVSAKTRVSAKAPVKFSAKTPIKKAVKTVLKGKVQGKAASKAPVVRNGAAKKVSKAQKKR